MFASETHKQDLFAACRTLFGPQISLSPEFFTYLQPVGIKSAYRKRALETHPDRARALGSFSHDLQEQFLRVQAAYEMLLEYLESGGPRAARSAPRSEPARPGGRRSRPRQGSDHFFQGSLPSRPLLLGQYLYYSGIISWRTLIDAIAWQRAQRPRIGQLALQWGLLQPDDILRVLRARMFNETFGECARRIGMLTNFEQNALVGRQRLLQPRLGRYFLGRNLFSPHDLVRLVTMQLQHNRSSVFNRNRATTTR